MKAFYFLVFAQLCDIITSIIGRLNGTLELNPIIGSDTDLITLKLLALVICFWIYMESGKNKYIFARVMVLMGIVTLCVAAHNLWVIYG